MIVFCVSRRCVVLFFCVMLCVCLCVYVMACIRRLFIEFIGLFCVCCSVLFLFFCFWCACAVCGVLCCCVLLHWFVGRVWFAVVLLFSFLFLLLSE